MTKLDEFLRDHKHGCPRRAAKSSPPLWDDERPCRCGRDDAAKELAEMRQIVDLAAVTDGMMPSDIAAREAAQAFVEAYPAPEKPGAYYTPAELLSPETGKFLTDAGDRLQNPPYSTKEK